MLACSPNSHDDADELFKIQCETLSTSYCIRIRAFILTLRAHLRDEPGG